MERDAKDGNSPRCENDTSGDSGAGDSEDRTSKHTERVKRKRKPSMQRKHTHKSAPWEWDSDDESEEDDEADRKRPRKKNSHKSASREGKTDNEFYDDDEAGHKHPRRRTKQGRHHVILFVAITLPHICLTHCYTEWYISHWCHLYIGFKYSQYDLQQIVFMLLGDTDFYSEATCVTFSQIS